MFQIAAQLLKDFTVRDKGLEAVPGFTIVLHTHNRRLDYHPHLHVIMAGGGFNAKRRCWVKKRGRYLFNETALAKVWRARILDWFNRQHWPVPAGIAKTWVVNCIRVGYGLPALKYLARYLYRGVVSEQNIFSDHQGNIEHCYKDSKTGKMKHAPPHPSSFFTGCLCMSCPKASTAAGITALPAPTKRDCLNASSYYCRYTLTKYHQSRPKHFVPVPAVISP